MEMNSWVRPIDGVVSSSLILWEPTWENGGTTTAEMATN
ncbi:hypothetical protein H4V95_002108 [Arthrobacter sp. CAN_C5]|nr:hypothetical protein [Arthrobacter sp. CAN_C5]